MKLKQLKKLLPKYVRNYKGNKPGNVLESSVYLVFKDPEQYKNYVYPLKVNDPKLDDLTVDSIVPVAAMRFYSSRGVLIVTLKP